MKTLPLRLRNWLKNLRDAMRRPLMAGAAACLVLLTGCALQREMSSAISPQGDPHELDFPWQKTDKTQIEK